MKRMWKGKGDFGFCRFWVGFRSSRPSNSLSTGQIDLSIASVLSIISRIWKNGFSFSPPRRRDSVVARQSWWRIHHPYYFPEKDLLEIKM
ncbi:unnamed protein product [Macrosiphum euphorbiae]|uniref:Uncharacterized protein n=1 Tax=Macrosiphum euphorbiae TaxID=13131 RepID=A0AAV0XRN1_9HEMI|nr:unnamed protein product [Macrosiphum euphorbiae]